MWTLDHIAITARDLAEGTEWAEERLGQPLRPGGRHDRFGTHNTLLGLSDGLYLEVIAPDPANRPEGPRWFGLNQFEGPPRLGNWICRTDDLSAAISASPPSVGQAVALSRGDLRWDIVVPDDGSLPLSGGWPTLMQWGEGARHPSDVLGDSGIALVELVIRHPEAEAIASRIAPFLRDDRIQFVRAPDAALSATVRRADGKEVIL